MKIAVTLALVANVESSRVARVQRDTDRRYFQLTDMMENYNPTGCSRQRLQSLQGLPQMCPYGVW